MSFSPWYPKGLRSGRRNFFDQPPRWPYRRSLYPSYWPYHDMPEVEMDAFGDCFVFRPMLPSERCRHEHRNKNAPGSATTDKNASNQVNNDQKESKEQDGHANQALHGHHAVRPGHEERRSQSRFYRPVPGYLHFFGQNPLEELEAAMDDLTVDAMHDSQNPYLSEHGTIPHQHHQKSSSYQSTSQTRVNGGKSYSYNKSTIISEDGEHKVTITRSIGDQKHIVTSIMDADGNEHQLENYVNVDTDNI
ncbi:uncharacterized protein TRIADDRAFT_52799 [Trichoplax adhaerens]|uniref:Uncharacterized protein n=1 Tax=Trichoplax adhaerens TaxID=10228 RepID=B3RKC9_TRIAD|nr:hypothetical protein TRIADDRAFT_52799 [Trichoplax adhaerens]EDV29906.1 hypothetical protein TRIADDRAFT_52799 [Trichoplax adhaerens]|eukprot:XP_002109108.1 hypothetical protein TRIADDRAFT_52799 [Trichoplax adhaerens]